jgi:hypothetical protein
MAYTRELNLVAVKSWLNHFPGLVQDAEAICGSSSRSLKTKGSFNPSTVVAPCAVTRSRGL